MLYFIITTALYSLGCKHCLTIFHVCYSSEWVSLCLFFSLFFRLLAVPCLNNTKLRQFFLVWFFYMFFFRIYRSACIHCFVCVCVCIHAAVVQITFIIYGRDGIWSYARAVIQLLIYAISPCLPCILLQKK